MERKRGNLSALLILTIFFTGPLLFAQGLDQQSEVERGLSLFAQGRYSEALPVFKQATIPGNAFPVTSNARYWYIISRIALGETSSVLPDIETFRTSFLDSRYLPDLLYQRGRIQFIIGDPAAAYETFKWFVNEPLWTHPLRPSAIYWMGECLLAMDKPELARTVFKAIVRDYSWSVKYEAARFRLETLEQKEREKALFSELETFRISATAASLEYSRKQLQYESTIIDLKRQVSDLNARLSAIQGRPAALSESAGVSGSAIKTESKSVDKLTELLAIKAETLDLLERYIRKMNSEGSK